VNHLYRAGITNRVNSVEVTKPPTTTVANGFCTSDPVPEDNNNGINPNAVVIAVMNIGYHPGRYPKLSKILLKTSIRS